MRRTGRIHHACLFGPRSRAKTSHTFTIQQVYGDEVHVFTIVKETDRVIKTHKVQNKLLFEESFKTQRYDLHPVGILQSLEDRMQKANRLTVH